MGKKGSETRKKIIDSTLFLLHSKSLDKISVREICEHSHIAKGTFYIHFEAKEDIAWAILSHNFDALIEEFSRLTHQIPDVHSIDNILDFIFDFSIQNSDILKLIHHVRFTEFIGKEVALAKYDSLFADFVSTLLTNGILSGLYHVDNVAFLSYFIASSIHELIDQVIYEMSPYNLTELKTETKGIINKLLR